MAEHIEILTLADRRRWEELDATTGLPSQSWRFAAPLTLSGYEPRLALVDTDGSRLVLPYFERQWQTCTDIATLPGLSGSSITPASSAPLARWHQFAVQRGWICGYIQLSPATYPNVPSNLDAAHRTHMFLLDPSTWDRQRTPSAIIRRKVAAALRSNASITLDRATVAPRLWPLYIDTLSRFGRKPQFTSATLHEWSLDPQNLLIGVMLDDVIEGAHLVHVLGEHAELHIFAVSERGRPLSALLYTEMLERLAALGVKCCNLGGGGDAGGGLFMFKSWLGAKPVPQQSVRQIYNRHTYEVLCRTADAESPKEYFPRYRGDIVAGSNG